MAKKNIICPHCGKGINLEDFRVLCRCQVCNYSWFTRTPTRPTQCPSCHSTYWDGKPLPRIVACLKCGNTWQAHVERPKMCPLCHRRDWDEVTNLNLTLPCGVRLSRAVFDEASYELCPNDGELMSIIKPILTERECKVIEMRFGFYGDHAQTLQQVGEYFGVTRERIRQIEIEALRKLRHPSVSKTLRGNVNG